MEEKLKLDVRYVVITSRGTRVLTLTPRTKKELRLCNRMRREVGVRFERA